MDLFLILFLILINLFFSAYFWSGENKQRNKMRTAIKTFAIIGIVFLGLAFLGNMNDAESLGYTILLAAAWLPLCILSLAENKKPSKKLYAK